MKAHAIADGTTSEEEKVVTQDNELRSWNANGTSKC